MSTEMWVVILLAWTVTGLLVAIAFGRMNQTEEVGQDEKLPVSSAQAIKYLRRNKRKATARLSSRDAVRQHRC
jgi:hypothetical protein